MDKPHKKFRVIADRRPELDLGRFADALLIYVLHCLREAGTEQVVDAGPEPAREAS